MGGTFNPIHSGHLLVGEAACEHLSLDEVIFIPAGTPPHKEKGKILFSSEERYEMTKLAIRGNPSFGISRYEIEKSTPSYAIQTIQHFSELYGKGTKLYFILGSDSIMEILSWYRGKEILDLCHFAVVVRPGFHETDLREKLKGYLKEKEKKVTIIRAPVMDVSSTHVRNRIYSGGSIRYLVPETVRKYIYKLLEERV